MVVGGVVSLAVFHAPVVPTEAAKFLIFLIWGTPRVRPLFRIVLILWYKPPRKKAQETPPTTSGGPTN
jgi:hypothetical protein